MKRIWVAIGFLVLSVVLAVTEFTLVSISCKKYTEQIEIAESYISDKEFSDAENICEKIEVDWEKSKKSLNSFLTHTYSDGIAESIARLIEYAKNKDIEGFLSQAGKTKRQLLHIKQSELPNLENIM